MNIEATRTAKAPEGYSGQIKVTAKAYQLNGNKHPHFSVTAVETGDLQACGCLHEEAAKAWPAIKPIIALHLSNADDGAPMHAEGNGYYWLAGCTGGLGEQYHGGQGKTDDECLAILANHLRISESEARKLASEIRLITAKWSGSVGYDKARQTFREFVDAQRPRWAREAQDGLALIKAEQEAK